MRFLRAILLTCSAAAIVISSSAALTPTSPTACTPGYAPCLPKSSDLNCGDIPEAKKPVRVTGADPYQLDRDRDGLGCELSDNASNTWGLVLRKDKKEAVTARAGDSLRVVGWVPSLAIGQGYQLCAKRGTGTRCVAATRALTRGIQVLGVWKVARDEATTAGFTLALRVKGQGRASDTVRIA